MQMASHKSLSSPDPSCPLLRKQRPQNSVCASLCLIDTGTYVHFSPNPPRLLRTHPELEQHAHGCPTREHRVGADREAHILKTQLRDTTGWNVRLFSPFPSTLSCSLRITHLRPNSQLESLQFKPALALIDTLLTELKRLDDKLVLTEVHLLESRVYRGIGNMPKSKVSSDIYTSI